MFTKQEFIEKYHQLSHSEDKLVRDQANQYILKVQSSDECWAIAKELLFHSEEIHFIACQLLYSKTKDSYQSLNKEQQIELRNFITNLLFQSKAPSQKKVCSTLALIMIEDSSLWQSSMDELIQLMKNGHMNLGLDILQQIAVETKEILGKQKQMMIQEAYFEQKEKIYEIMKSLLVLKGDKVDILNCIDSWVEFELQFLENEQIIQLLCQNALQEGEYFIQICSILTNIIKFSTYKHIHKSDSSLKECAQLLPESQQYLTQIPYQNIQEKYISALSELTTRFTTDYMIFVINNPKPLLDLISYLTSHQSRRTSYQTFEFWIEFRQLLFKKKKETDQELCYAYFLQLLQPILNNCRVKNAKITVSENESDDENEPIKSNLNAMHYREYSKEIFFTIYEAAKDMNKSNLFFHILKQNLLLGQVSDKDLVFQITQTETAIFAAQIVFDDFQTELNNDQIFFIANYILNLEANVEQQRNDLFEGWMNIIVKTALQLFYEFTQQIKFDIALFRQVILFILKYMSHKQLGPLAGQALEAISTTVEIEQTYQIIDELISYFVHYWKSFINQIQVENFICAMLSLSSKIQNQQLASIQFQKILKTVEDEFINWTNINQNSSEEAIDNMINLVLSALNWFTLNSESVSKEIYSLASQVTSRILNPILNILEKLPANLDILSKAVKLLKIALKVSDFESQQTAVQNILNLSFKTIISDPVNKSNWFEIIQLAIIRSDSQGCIFQWLLTNLEEINNFCLNSYQKTQDPDLLKHYIAFLRQIVVKNQKFIINCQQFGAILQTLSNSMKNNNQYELQRETLFFFKQFWEITQNGDINSINYQKCVPIILKILFSNIHEINQILIWITHQINDKQQLSNLIQESLSEGWGQDKEPNQVKLLNLVAKSLVLYATQTQIGSHNRNLKLLLCNLRFSGEQDINYPQLQKMFK